MYKKISLAALTLAAMAGPAFAGGYQVSLQGQKQIGMGHVGTALAWDASSIFFNPGSLAFLKKSSVLGGASFISSKIAYLGPGSSTYKATTDNPLATPFAAYGAFLLGAEKRFAIGVGVYTPYGSTVKWGESWAGTGVLNSLSLQAIVANATVSYRLTDMISVGGGFTYGYGGVDLKRTILPVYDGTYGQAQLKGDASGIGFTGGIHVKASEKFSIGASYRHQIVMKVEDGDATATVNGIAKNGTTFPRSGQTKFDAALPLPSVASIGFGYKATDELTLGLDVNYTFWSSYKALGFSFDSSFGGATSTVSPRNYKDAVAVRIGGDYALSDQLSVRAGAYFDQTPVQDGYLTPETPDANRIGLSAGLGVKPVKGLFIDASILWIAGMKRTQTQAQIESAGTQTAAMAGTYQQRALIPGIQIGYEF